MLDLLQFDATSKTCIIRIDARFGVHSTSCPVTQSFTHVLLHSNYTKVRSALALTASFDDAHVQIHVVQNSSFLPCLAANSRAAHF